MFCWQCCYKGAQPPNENQMHLKDLEHPVRLERSRETKFGIESATNTKIIVALPCTYERKRSRFYGRQTLDDMRLKDIAYAGKDPHEVDRRAYILRGNGSRGVNCSEHSHLLPTISVGVLLTKERF